MFVLKFLAFMHFVTALRSLVIGTLDTNEMPPKRNNPSSSSSSNWDTTRFVLEAAEKRYKKKFFVANAISERGMFLSKENFNDVPILEFVSTLKWNSFIKAPKEAIKQIYKILNIPQEKCAFCALKDEENPDYKEIAKEQGCANAKPWTISSTSHKPKSINSMRKARVPWLDSELLMDLMGPICSANICEAQRKKLDQRSASEARHQELVGELRLLKLRAAYNTSFLEVVQTNVREFIGFIANEIKFPKYQDCPPLPPEL
ncbi:uncharacterized protein G2W53_041770 [Senna tora]|uniref:Uncharacterized protein n=1 Tax=Senna tora TaxID=362788 RepID=A0A834SFR2_9FABA|nr:uncharacterized protein G2W53_041770 [Senna tora]